MRYILVMMLFLIGYTFMYAGISNFFPQYTLSPGGGI